MIIFLSSVFLRLRFLALRHFHFPMENDFNQILPDIVDSIIIEKKNINTFEKLL